MARHCTKQSSTTAQVSTRSCSRRSVLALLEATWLQVSFATLTRIQMRRLVSHMSYNMSSGFCPRISELLLKTRMIGHVSGMLDLASACDQLDHSDSPASLPFTSLLSWTDTCFLSFHNIHSLVISSYPLGQDQCTSLHDGAS